MQKNNNRYLLRRRQSFILNYNKKTALRAAIVLSFILAFVMLSSSLFFISLDETNEVRFTDLISFRSAATLIVNTLVLYYLFRVQFWAIVTFPNNRKRMWPFLVGTFLIIAFVTPVFSRLQWWWFRGDVSDKAFSTFHYVKDVMVLIISFLFTALIYLINQNQKKLTENQNLVIENLKNRYNALKSQIDPHFLFNSLNTLNGLIGFDDDRAREYLTQLSSVFRYTMQDNSVVRVADEIKFIDSYLYMMKIRYHEGLNVSIDIDSHYKNKFILPFALQMLVENAIKHNVVSRKNPLNISIMSTPHHTIIVSNNLQKKQSAVTHSGLGLANLSERCHLISGKEIEIRSSNDHFEVEIPLFDDNKNLKKN